MAARLKGKTIVITGASSGIGRATAVEFARTQPDDLRLILTARREETLKEVAREIEGFATGVKVLPVKLDVSDVSAVEGFVGKLPEEWRGVDVLVNNACVYVQSPPHPCTYTYTPPSILVLARCARLVLICV